MKNGKVKKIAVIGVIVTLILNCLCACSFVFPWENNGGTQQIPLTEMTYVAFGDSITWGEDGSTHQRMKSTYPELVAEMLELKDFENNGQRGASITFKADSPFIGTQIQETTTKANIVSVMIGVNDFLGAHTLGTIEDTTADCVYGGLNYLAKELLKKYPNAFIFFMTPLNQTKSPNVNSAGYTLVDVCDAIKAVCEANNIEVLDLNTTVEFTSETDPNSDGLHPTQQFAVDYIAPQIANFIKINIK